MAFHFPDTDPAHLLGAMRKCWEDTSDRSFDAFCAEWTQLMQADLAQFTGKLALVDQICKACHGEYRHEFSVHFDEDYDYGLLFRAIAYSHFSHTLEDRGVQALLRVSGISLPFGSTSASGKMNHEVCVIVFAAVLSVGGHCTGHLLDMCLEVRTAGVVDGCFTVLKLHLEHIQ
jgi:hypothetical protein